MPFSDVNLVMGFLALRAFPCMLRQRPQCCSWVASLSCPRKIRFFFFNLKPCSLQCIISTPPWFWLLCLTLNHCHCHVCRLPCVSITMFVNLALRCPLKTACCSEMWTSGCCFIKQQVPSQSDTNYWVGTSKSISDFQLRSQLFTRYNSGSLVVHLELVCFALDSLLLPICFREFPLATERSFIIYSWVPEPTN